MSLKLMWAGLGLLTTGVLPVSYSALTQSSKQEKSKEVGYVSSAPHTYKCTGKHDGLLF